MTLKLKVKITGKVTFTALTEKIAQKVSIFSARKDSRLHLEKRNLIAVNLAMIQTQMLTSSASTLDSNLLNPNTFDKVTLYFNWLLSGEKDLTFPAEADVFLLTFLRPCKFYPKSAFEKMQKYFKFRLKHKKICENITVESVRKVFEDDLIKYLPERDLDGRRILYLNCGSKKNIRVQQKVYSFFLGYFKKNGNLRESRRTTYFEPSSFLFTLQWQSRWHKSMGSQSSLIWMDCHCRKLYILHLVLQPWFWSGFKIVYQFGSNLFWSSTTRTSLTCCLLSSSHSLDQKWVRFTIWLILSCVTFCFLILAEKTGKKDFVISSQSVDTSAFLLLRFNFWTKTGQLWRVESANMR